MRIVNQPIQMIAWFKEDGTAHPMKFRYQSTDDMWENVKVERILLQEKSRFVGIGISMSKQCKG
ncbi:hypothetical protein Amet_3234 [Alkaliphilus metalliredigens QYMF]|uniref:Uncharacterized protein n=1 Tax=Alkaliphilus metalliredigens (strain QYMF) TaxID=293826 RepID=A6TT54_ALKMQ|nr:hypothetical protein [Alkaliphilus metalliredigens]ABR49372.1 hypothetical protein Amet_3234 [Alkaliphilus metalliredigens QYMF]